MKGAKTARALSRSVLPSFVNAVVSVPDGLASAALAGVNPVHGLYTSVAAPVAGGLVTSSQLMQIATTSASALAAAQAIKAYPVDQRGPAIFLLVAMAGVFLAVFGLLRLGHLIRFISHSVMTGFLIGVATVLVLDQLAPFVGVVARGGNEIAQFVNLLSQRARFDPPTILVGLLALALSLGLRRTRLGTLASVLALVLPSLVAVHFGWDSVDRVADASPMPRGLPWPALPNLALMTPALVLSAFSLAVVIAVQGAGVSEGVENPDGSRVRPSRDFLAQGAANLASGFFSGIPAGGSVGQTALNVSIGATNRWACVLSGFWMLAFVTLFPGAVGKVPMAVLAALMIQAGLSAIDFREARSIWNTGGSPRLSMGATFLGTLVLPIPVAVATGVAMTVLLFLWSSANDVSVRAVTSDEQGRQVEGPPSARLQSRSVAVLNVYGSLFFAGAHTLREALPDPKGADSPVVILRLRGHKRVGTTLIEMLDDYADELQHAGGRLYLTGLSDGVTAQLRRAGKFDLNETVRLVPAVPVMEDSTEKALASALAWLNRKA